MLYKTFVLVMVLFQRTKNETSRLGPPLAFVTDRCRRPLASVTDRCRCPSQSSAGVRHGLVPMPVPVALSSASEGEEPCVRADEMEYYYEVMDFYEVLWWL